MGVAVGGFHFKHAFPDIEDGDIKSTAAKVIYGNRFFGFLIQTVSQGGCGRFVDDTENVKTGDFTGILGGLTLTVVEISRNGDYRLFDFFAQIGFRVGFQFLKDHC